MEVSSSELGSRLVEEGERRAKLFRLTNRLAQAPGELDAIRDYVDLLLAAINNASPADSLEHYDRIEAFLLDRASHVDPDEVEDLLSIATTLDERRKETAEQAEKNVRESKVDSQVAQTLEHWKDHGVDTTVPEKTAEAQSRLQRCRKVRDLARTRNGEVPDDLESLIRRLQVAVETDKLLNRVGSLVGAALSEEHPSEAAYILQSAEQAVQKLVMKRFEVSSDRRERIESTVRNLEDASRKVSRRRREKQGERRWAKFVETNKEDLNFASNLDPEDVDSTSSSRIELGDQELRLTGEKTKLEPGENTLTQSVDRLQELLQRLSETASAVDGREVQSSIKQRIDMVESKLNALQNQREQVYNEFALARLERAFEEAEDAMEGFRTDIEGIAEALVDYVAEIDQRYLTSEVGQSYTEVFQHLYDELDDVDSSDDFEEKETKLGTLKRMRERETIDLRDF